MKQVRTEAAGLDLSLQVSIGRGDDPHVDKKITYRELHERPCPRGSSLDEKRGFFEEANTKVAVLCNHQRNVGALHDRPPTTPPQPPTTLNVARSNFFFLSDFEVLSE